MGGRNSLLGQGLIRAERAHYLPIPIASHASSGWSMQCLSLSRPEIEISPALTVRSIADNCSSSGLHMSAGGISISL